MEVIKEMARLELEIFDKGNLVEEMKNGYAVIRIYDSSYRNRTKADCERSWENVEKMSQRLAREGKLKVVT